MGESRSLQPDCPVPALSDGSRIVSGATLAPSILWWHRLFSHPGHRGSYLFAGVLGTELARSVPRVSLRLVVPAPWSVTLQGVLLRVHLQPRAARDRVVGLHGEALKVALTAAPVENAANSALLAFL